MGEIVSPKEIWWSTKAGTCECNLIWKLSLCKCNQVAIRSYWSRVNPKSIDQYPYKERVTWRQETHSEEDGK